MTTQAVIHQLKSEYVEARSIQTGILEKTSIQDPQIHCLALINVAESDVMVGALKDDVWRNYLYLMEGNPLAAQSFCERHLKKMTLEYSQVQTYCLERLGDASCWGGLDGMSNWTTTKQVQGIDERIANISEDLLEQHRNNLACLAELHVRAGTVEELEDDLSEIEGLDKVDIGDEKELGSIVA
ncbi:hypothetical protein B0H13DRAFT_1901794 [Mycena leptocephala]|nr:hypothetical protein B0H13DRAFT_1901794 [Mycena leptocephala]